MASGDNVDRDRTDVVGPGRADRGTIDPDRRVRTSVRVHVLLGLGVLGVLANALPQLATGWPTNTSQWVLLAVGALADAVLVALSLDRLLVAAPGGWSWVRRLRWPVRLRVVVAAAVAIGLLAGAATAATNLWLRVDRLINGCPEPAGLRILTTPESLDPSRQLAGAYEQQTAAGNRGCRTVDVYVAAAGAAPARDALAGGWSTDALRDVGPRPDVWLPDSSLQVAELRALAARNGIAVPLAEDRTVAWSPIVVGIPGSVAATVRAPRNGVAWSDLLAQLTGVPGGLVRPDPGVSVAGQIATTALYADLAGARDSPRGVESRIARALDRGGYPLADSGPVLCRQRAPDAPAAAIVTSEQALTRFNRGDTLGGECAVAQDKLPPGPSLLAFYPSATPGMDHPFVRLAWDTGPEPDRPAGAAADFGRWLGTADGKQALLSIGLRPAAGFDITGPLTNEFGALPGAVFDRRPPDPAAVTAAMRRYDTARRTGRVLLAVDTSGSMGQPTRAGRTRLSVAAEGIRGSLALMGPADEFGLWTFPANTGGTGVRAPVPIGSRDTPVAGQPRTQATMRSLGVQPAGGTPLFATIVKGVQALGGADGDRIRALVVLTDGEDTTSGLTAQQVLDAVRDKGVRVFVVAVGEASCAGPVLASLTAATGGGCYQADFETVDTRLAQLFGVLWEGDGRVG
ncbi:MAG: Ca-activated chloride channel [Micromonosporaceae bacterium]